jgi:hypothetical protein
MDCKRDTGARGLKEYPLMLRDEVWLSIAGETGGAGVLCRADMERRLGRPLTADDMMTSCLLAPDRTLDDGADSPAFRHP